MTAPAKYRGSAKVVAKVDDLAARLDPQRWHKAFPYIWMRSDFTGPDPGYFVLPEPSEGRDTGEGEKRKAADLPPDTTKDALPPARSDPPRPPPPRDTITPGGAPLSGTERDLATIPLGKSSFFEVALFGGYTFRNVLEVTVTRDPDRATKDLNSAEYKYFQKACLNATRDPLDLQGGIDVDSGTASVRKVEGSPDHVFVAIEKAVRFTKPATLVDEMNDLAHVFIPLSLDSWLHGLIFSSPDEEGETNG